MAKSIREIRVRKKPGPPRTTGPGTPVLVRLQQPMLGDIDEWRARQKDKPSRAEAIRRLLVRLQDEVTRLRGENAGLRGEVERLQGETTIDGSVGSQGGG